MLLSRSLNDEVGAIRPSRIVAADPCAYRINKKRIVFEASGVELPFGPADNLEIVRSARGRVSVFLDESDEVPSFLGALRWVRAQGVPLRLTLSSRADDDLAGRVHATFDDDPRVEVHDAEPPGFEDRSDFQISNELIALLTGGNHRTHSSSFVGAFWRVNAKVPQRSDIYLFRGEESNAHGLLDAWLGRRDCDGPHPAPWFRRGDRAAGRASSCRSTTARPRSFVWPIRSTSRSTPGSR